MTEELQTRVARKTTQEIAAKDLQEGGFAFQLPEGTPEDEVKIFNEQIDKALQSGQNLILSSDVKIIDKKAKPRGEPISVEVAKPVEEAKEEATTEETTTETTEQPPEQPVQPQFQPQFVQPQNNVQYSQNQQWQYDPFTGAPIRPAVAQPVQQPVPQQPVQQPQQSWQPYYAPQYMTAPQGQAYNPQPVFPQPSFVAQPQQPTEQKKQGN